MKKLLTGIILFILLGFRLYAQGPHDVQLYGMTQYGGTNFRGTIFHYTPSTKSYFVDYEFQIKAKGKTPKSELVNGRNGKYYGTTTAGGESNAGVIFSWDSASGDYQEPYHFTGTDGADARGAMVLLHGKLYGMTNAGGANQAGTIYAFDLQSQTFTKKVDLDSATGKNPQGSLFLMDSIFYGCTFSGGAHDKGVLFTWNPQSNLYTKHYDFDSAFGANPVGRMALFNGKLYAMTMNGGTHDAGIIYEWNPATHVVTKKFDFNNTNGAHPMGHLSLYNNKLYGITNGGGAFQPVLQFPAGVIFEYNPVTNVFTKKKDLGFRISGQIRANFNSLSSLTLKDNIFWGTTTTGSLAQGGFFTWNPADNQYKDRTFTIGSAQCEIDRLDYGKEGYGALLVSGNFLLGTNAQGGGHASGCVFKFSPDSNRIADAVHMQYSDGAYPKGSLVQVGHKLYGFTFQGGRNHTGNILEWDLHSKELKELYNFNYSASGIQTRSGPLVWNGRLYGINSYGAAYNVASNYLLLKPGDIFSWDLATRQYRTHGDARSGRGALSLYYNKMYFTSPAEQSIVRFDPETDSLKSVAFLPPGGGTFDNYQDYFSANNITWHQGKFYGLTPAKLNSGALPFRGTVYEWDTNTTVMANKIDFVDSVGVYPTGSLLSVGSDLYGLTTGIGMQVNSTLFRYEPAGNNLKKLAEIPQRPFGTPTLSNGNIFFSNDGAYSMIYEYDPVLDTNYLRAQVQNPEFFSRTWNNNCTRPPAYIKLLEVIPNKDPQLLSLPAAQTICSRQTGLAEVRIFDADNDTLRFKISSTDTSLIDPQSVTVTRIDTVYRIRFTGSTNQNQVDTLFFTGTDGYGGSVQFSMVVEIRPLPDTSVTQNGAVLTANEANATYQWLICSTNTAIAGATDQTYTAIENNAFAVVVTQNNCSDTSACRLVTTVGIEKKAIANQLTILPNPASQAIFLQFGKDEGALAGSIVITNLLGEQILAQPITHDPIGIAGLPSGVYFVRAEAGNQVFMGRFVKE